MLVLIKEFYVYNEGANASTRTQDLAGRVGITTSQPSELCRGSQLDLIIFALSGFRHAFKNIEELYVFNLKYKYLVNFSKRTVSKSVLLRKIICNRFQGLVRQVHWHITSVVKV
jgi:hypothetical protein